MPSSPPLKPQPKEEKVVSKEDEEFETDSEDEERVMGKDNEMEEEKGSERDKEEVTLDAPQENPRKRKADRLYPRITLMPSYMRPLALTRPFCHRRK